MTMRFRWCLVFSGMVLFGTGSSGAFEFKGFMDAQYKGSLSRRASPELRKGSFVLGALDLYASHAVSDRVDVLSEIAMEAPAGEIIVDVERIEVGYAFGDWLNVRAGRFHTPLGVYAHRYHHGRHLDSSVDRPLVIEFEDGGGLVPAHSVGLWLRGTAPAGPGDLSYNAGVSNGHSIDVDNRELKINMTSDDNANKAVFGSLSYQPEFLEGLGLGASLYHSRVFGYTVAGGTTPVIEADQLIAGGNLHYFRRPVELLAEYYSLAHKDLRAGGRSRRTSQGYFLQGSYGLGRLRPYLRYEAVLPRSGDVFTTALIGEDDVKRVTCGVRFDLFGGSALKLEGVSESRGARKDVPLFGAQWTFAF